MEIKDVVIIGGGVAGTTVALYLGRAGFKPVLLTDGEIGGNLNSIDTIQNYVGIYNAKGSDISEALNSQLSQAGIFSTIYEYAKVTNVSDKNGRLFPVLYSNHCRITL